MLVLNLILLGHLGWFTILSGAAGPYHTRLSISKSCGQGIHMQIILILISAEVLQAAYFGFGTDYAGSWFR